MSSLCLNRYFQLVVVTSALLPVASCGGDEGGGEEVSADVVLGDVQIIESDSALHDVRDMANDAAGRVWVLSGFEPFVHVLDERTGEIARFGRIGQGPGELRTPWYFVERSDAAAPVIWDVGNRRLLEYDSEGTLARETGVESRFGIVIAGYRATEFGTPMKLVESGGVLVVQAFDDAVVQSSDLWSGALTRLNAAGLITDTIFRFSSLEGSRPDESYSVFGPGPLWTACRTDELVVLDPNADELIWLRSDGTQFERWSLDLPQIPILKRDVEAYIRHSIDAEIREQGGGSGLRSTEVGRFLQRAVSRLVASAPERAPIVGLECDGSGRIWLQLFSTAYDARGYGPRWVVTDGEVSRSVEFPGGFQPLRFLKDHVLGYVADDLGVQRPARVPLPPELSQN